MLASIMLILIFWLNNWFDSTKETFSCFCLSLGRLELLNEIVKFPMKAHFATSCGVTLKILKRGQSALGELAGFLDPGLLQR